VTLAQQRPGHIPQPHHIIEQELDGRYDLALGHIEFGQHAIALHETERFAAVKALPAHRRAEPRPRRKPASCAR
jgi:hypothetical protein